jgi:hypothetical protein
VLKLDIEGAEYRVLEQLCATGRIDKVGQLLVEFHHGWTEFSIADTRRMTGVLASHGLALLHTEGRNHIFRRTRRSRGPDR